VPDSTFSMHVYDHPPSICSSLGIRMVLTVRVKLRVHAPTDT
jgi:hypothetical protein